MRNVLKSGLTLALGAAIIGGMVFSAPQSADARPNIYAAFGKKYTGLKDQVKTTKCGVCHVGKDKKIRNIYGKALFEALGKKEKVKDKEQLDKAFAAAEKMKSAVKDKTFGDLIKAGKLPASAK